MAKTCKSWYEDCRTTNVRTTQHTHLQIATRICGSDSVRGVIKVMYKKTDVSFRVVSDDFSYFQLLQT